MHSCLIHSSTDGLLGCFQHVAVVNSAAMNVEVHKFFWVGDLGVLWYIPSSGFAGSKGSSILVFWGDSILFSTVAAPATFCDSVDGTGEYYAKWSKPVGERQIPYDLTYKRNLMNKIN